jgi:hypothetical protein
MKAVDNILSACAIHDACATAAAACLKKPLSGSQCSD